jgi:hypothetical protein
MPGNEAGAPRNGRRPADQTSEGVDWADRRSAIAQQARRLTVGLPAGPAADAAEQRVRQILE